MFFTLKSSFVGNAIDAAFQKISKNEFYCIFCLIRHQKSTQTKNSLDDRGTGLNTRSAQLAAFFAEESFYLFNPEKIALHVAV